MTSKKINYIIIGAVVLIAVVALVWIARGRGGAAPEKITEPAAVFFEPSRAWKEEMKKTYGEDEFKKVEESVLAYREQARGFLESKNIKIVDTAANALSFVKDSGEEVVVDRMEAERGGWGIYLFNGKENPVDASSADIQAVYERLFVQSQ